MIYELAGIRNRADVSPLITAQSPRCRPLNDLVSSRWPLDGAQGQNNKSDPAGPPVGRADDFISPTEPPPAPPAADELFERAARKFAARHEMQIDNRCC